MIAPSMGCATVGAEQYGTGKGKAGGRRSSAAPRGGHKQGGRAQGALPRGKAQLAGIVEQRAFVLHFQPIVGLHAGGTRHYEALLRLPDGCCGPLLSPEPFLRAAERHGLAAALDRAVLEVALEQVAGSTATVAVNLSAHSLADRSLPAFLAEALARFGVAGERVILEITETAAIADLQEAACQLAEIRGL